MQIALLIASLVAGIVQGEPQISANIRQIVQDVYRSLSAIVSSGATSTVNPATILAALSGVIAALKADPNLPADKLALISAIDNAILAALAADKVAQQGVDPTQLKPIEPLA